jgi:2-iminobutanoate/2-iminopropanoate deaminase
MSKSIISVPNAPKLPFSPGVKAGDHIFISGQIGHIDPKTGDEIEGIEAQTRQCIENMREVLRSAGSDLSDVVKVTVFLRGADDFVKMNEVYQSYFTGDLPARSTVVTGLVIPGMLIEMECVAYCP